ncbi:uncharacterized protein BYT42DRAFT_374199 [Radiomyces spectabilis]|uniref:uncharacterized protein n=1 Tax=Radiomyces spectabilis TaxID=64574 RepID=UPI00221E9257|nr:uncharacterized protein BYT42DRAFT_374199 [Radiomyces spectabilis]KAI8376090.1 hypothetical protein BYT42DRAFT_374199 [Radiomyces spectabilis]
MPCLTYDGGVNIVMAPFASRRIHHFQWDALPVPMYDNYASTSNSTPNETSASTTAAAPNSVTPCQSTSTPHPSETNVPTSISTSSSSSLLSSRRLSSTLTTLLGRHSKKTKSTDLSDHAPCASTEKKSAVRLRRHSSYNDYGYACQMRTAEYIRQYRSNKLIKPVHPDFSARLKLINSIRTTPLGRPALETVNIAMYHDHVATVNRYGDIALYALNGTTAARVSTHDGQCEWIENKADLRDDDDLSDGYNFVRSRLAIGSLGIVYGGRNGQLWWLDFGCKPKSI